MLRFLATTLAVLTLLGGAACRKSASSNRHVPTPPAADALPAAEADDHEFKADADKALIESTAAWREKNVGISIEGRIPFKNRISILNTVKDAASRQDLTTDLQRLKIQVIQISTRNFIYRNTVRENAVTVTWKLEQSPDEMLQYLQTLTEVPE